MTRYEVTGGTPFLDHPPGTIFEADLDEETEAWGFQTGSITKTTKKETKEEGNDA